MLPGDAGGLTHLLGWLDLPRPIGFLCLHKYESSITATGGLSFNTC